MARIVASPTIRAMSDGVHLLDSLRLQPAPRAAREALRGPGACRNWRSCSRGWRPRTPTAATSTSLSTPHERVLARACGLPATDGCIPWAAWQVHQAGRDAAGRGLGLDHALPLARGHRPHRHGASAGPAARCATTRRRCWRRCSPSSSRTASPWNTTRPRCWLARGEVFRDLRHRLAGPRGRPHHRRLDAARRGRPRPCAGCSRRCRCCCTPMKSTTARSAAGCCRSIPSGSAAPAPCPARRGRRRRRACRSPTTCATPRCVEDWRGWAAAWQQLDASECARLCQGARRAARPCPSHCAASAMRTPGPAATAGVCHPHGQPVRPQAARRRLLENL